MKIIKILLMALCIATAVVSASTAESPRQQTVRIAAFNFYPAIFQAKDGSVQGFYVDFLREIALKEGWNIEYVYGNWADGLARIKNGEVDVLTNVAFTTERALFMDYGKTPLLTVWAELYVPDSSEIDSIRQVKGKKIALMKGDFNAANFRNLVEKFEIPCEYVEYSNFDEVLKAVSAKQVDGGVVNNTFGAAKQREYKEIKSSGVIFNPFDIYFTVARGQNRQIIETLDKYLAEWRKNESSPYHQARERWAHGSASTIRVTPVWLQRSLVLLLISSGVAAAFILMLRSQVRRKTSELKSQVAERIKVADELHLATVQLEEELAERQIAQESLQEQATILEEEIEERRRAEEALQKSEATILNKLKVILEPQGDIGTLELSDIIDSETLQSILEDFYKLTGMLGAVLDVSGKVLVAVGWQDICTKFHRCHPETLKNCIESDTILTNDVPVGTFRQYRCKNNMWDMVTPLVVDGKQVGNVFIGQFFYENETPDVELFREQARQYGFDEKEYLAALDRVPRFSREMADAGMKFYAKLTNMISTLCYSSIKVSRMLTERIHLEEQLRQSQKMEAIGQLAGGVAHDFNNILTVIMGYASLLQMGAPLNERQKEAAVQIVNSSEKAAQLTCGLLAFSRKQLLNVRKENLNDIVHHIQKLLVRVIGEDIQLKLIANELKLPVNVDSGQIEQVLMNLVTNARDAMQKGGVLTIETALQEIEAAIENPAGRIAPGRYACIAVSDTGNGMDEETCSRIFEPFFTTKVVGKGTGLGMAIVYGIVKQHNGFINVYSEPGVGTTFRIHLPLVEGAVSDQTVKKELAAPQGGTETILLAEDEPDVCKLVTTVLTQVGYNVIQAKDGQDAVEKFTANRERIAMILMDIIMPKKNGKEAYEEICRLKPGVKVLYSSGYTADFIQSRGVDEEGIELIMKPVQPMELLRKVREMLDR